MLNRTKLVDATIERPSPEPRRGRDPRHRSCCSCCSGTSAPRSITALAIPLSMLLTATGMVQGRISGNLMSLGAHRLRPDRRRRRDHRRELPAPAGRAPARAGSARCTLDERLATVTAAAKEMIQPTVFGQAIIIMVYVPILTLTGIEGKMFEPMALTVIFALAAAFVLSLTFVPAMVAIADHAGASQERENVVVRGSSASTRRRWRASIRSRSGGRCGAWSCFAAAALAVRAARAGVRPDARREGHRDARASASRARR